MVINKDSIMLLISLLVASFLIYRMSKIKNKNNLIKVYLWINIFLVLYFVALFLQILFSNTAIKPIYFDYIAYISAIMIPVLFFIFSREYNGKGNKFAKLYFIIPIISLIVLWTSDFHKLFYENYSTDMASVVYGPYFYVHMIYSYGLLALSFINIIINSVKRSGFLTNQTALVIIGELVPLVPNVLGSLKIIPISIYVTPIMFTVTSMCFYIAVFRLKAFNITPIAFRTIIDTMSDAYIVISNDGTIVDNNKTFHNIFKDILNNNKDDNLFEMLLEKNLIDIEDLKKNIEKTRTDGKIVTTQYHIEIKDEKNSTDDEIKYIFNKYFEVDIHPIKASRGKEYVGTLLLFKDVTQHTEDMLELKAKQDVIVKQGQLVSIGELAGGVAHDINTPISAIKTGITVLKEFYQPRDDRESEVITRMDSCADKIIKIVNSMRNQIRNLGSSEKVRFKVSDVIKDIQVITANEFQKNKCILNINIRDEVEVMGEPTKLGQVITNLVVNAIQAYPEGQGGKVEIDVSRAPEGKCMIKVTDFAGGIPDSIKDNIFKNILTTKGTKGTGLGLYLAYSVIKGEFSGNITFETEKGGGTTFYIVLDRADLNNK